MIQLRKNKDDQQRETGTAKKQRILTKGQPHAGNNTMWPHFKLHALVILIAVFFNPGICVAQKFDLGSWNIIGVRYYYNDKLDFFGEAQLRSLKFYNDYYYHEFKAGVDYKVSSNLKFTLGAGKYDTYREGGSFVKPKNNDEFRIWPQAILLQTIWKLKIEQRYRAEFRFSGSGYRNRFRYRLGISYPFGKQKNGDKPFQVSASNELFFTGKEPYFERNRLFFSINYRISKRASLQLGYLHQFDYKINNETGRDFLVLGLFLELYGKQSHKGANDIKIRDN